MASKQIGRPAKSVYDMTTKQYMNWLLKNRITKEWIIDCLKTEIYIDYQKGDEKLTLKQLIEKYGDDLKHMVNEWKWYAVWL